jgi:AraC-like DNA-binding protein
VLIPGKQHTWKLQSGTKGQALIIRKALIETFTSTLQFSFSEYNPHRVLDLDVTTYKKIDAEFLAIKKELSSTTIFTELVNARCRLIALMLTLWGEHKFGNAVVSSDNSNPVAYKFHSLIEHHFKTQKLVSFYAKHLCITPNYLGVICRKQYGMSALELIQERVLLEAKRLLHSSGRSIKEIAFDLGFRNQTYFSYFFKAKTSLTPKEYKNLLEKS